ncbi:MAG: ribosomal protein S18-alanine N-acetyltransferase [Aeromicrobium sp.]
MIRLADTTDIEAIAGLEREIFGADAWSVAQVAADVEAPLRPVVVAEVEGVVVGYAVIALAGDIADLMRIAVRESFRRAGVASRLSDDVERLGAAAGAARMALEVAASNAAAQDFYGARGYLEIARRRAYYANGDDALVMVRALG